MSLAIDVSEFRSGRDTLDGHSRSPSSCSSYSCTGSETETHGSQKELYVPVHRRTATGASQTSTAPSSVASCSPREGTKSLPSDRDQRARSKPSSSLYTREELLTLAPSSLIHTSLHPVVTPALVSKFPSILRVKGDGIAKALEMARTPVNRHAFFLLPPVPEPFPIPVQNTGFRLQRARRLHPQVASAISPFHNTHLHGLLWAQNNLRRGQYGYPHLMQPSVEFSLPPIRPKPTLRPADDVRQMPAQPSSHEKAQTVEPGLDPVIIVADSDKGHATSTEAAMSPSLLPPHQTESTPAQERRRRRQRDRRRRQRAKQATTTSDINGDGPDAAHDKESSDSLSAVLPDASSKDPTSPRERSASAPLRQHTHSNIPKPQRQPSNLAAFDKQTRQRPSSIVPGLDMHRQSVSGKRQPVLNTSGAAQVSDPTHKQIQQVRKAVSKPAQARHEAEAGHRFRFARAGEPDSWRMRRTMQVAQPNAA